MRPGLILLFPCLFACGEDRATPLESGGDVFVAVGAQGVIVQGDGTTWARAVSGTQKALISVAAGASGFVAVGEDGAVLSSRDGVSWTARDSGTTTTLSHVIYNGSEFIAAGGGWENGAAVIKSRDGMSWAPVDSPANYMFHAIARAGDILIASAYHRSDLLTPALFKTTLSPSSASSGWTEIEGPPFYDSLIDGDRIIVAGGSSLSSSSDGVTWERHSVPSAHSVSFDGMVYVIAGERAIYSARDGKEWTEQVVPGIFHGVTHGKTGFVAAGANGAIATSADGFSWNSAALSGVDEDLFDVAYRP